MDSSGSQTLGTCVAHAPSRSFIIHIVYLPVGITSRPLYSGRENKAHQLSDLPRIFLIPCCIAEADHPSIAHARYIRPLTSVWIYSKQRASSQNIYYAELSPYSAIYNTGVPWFTLMPSAKVVIFSQLPVPALPISFPSRINIWIPCYKHLQSSKVVEVVHRLQRD